MPPDSPPLPPAPPPSRRAPRALDLRWVLLALPVLVSLPLVIYAIGLLRVVSAEAQAELRDELSRGREALVSSLAGDLDATSAVLELMARAPRPDPDSPPSEAWVEALQDTLGPRFGIASIRVQEPDGRLRLDVRSGDGVTQAPLRPHQLASLADGRPRVSDLHRTPRGTWAASIAAPVPDSRGPHWVATARLDPARLGQPLTLTVAPGAGNIGADRVRITQVLENLLGNALKFTRDADAIRVSAHGSPDHVEIRVGDEGVGIEAASLPRIFELFVQADPSLDRAHGGLGIGLAWVKAIVESHGGTVRADSAGADRGAKFVVRWPRGGPVATG